MLSQQQNRTPTDESNSLISGFKQTVFGATQQVQQQATYQDSRIALVFLLISGLFFFAAIAALPMVLLSPGSFNLYFLFGSLNLQAAFAFWYGPLSYFKSMFEEGKQLVSTIYFCSLLLCLYIALFKGGYLLSIVGIAVQVTALMVIVKQAISGPSEMSMGQQFLFTSLFKGWLGSRK